MTLYEERKIEIPGFNLAVKIWNPKNTRPVLCLHGLLDNAASFDLLAPLLPNLQLAAIDYPGTGFSSHYPQGILPHWKNDAFLLIHVLKALGWEQFDLIGHSLGGLLATLIAIALPKQVRKLVYLDILGPKLSFIEKGVSTLPADMENYLNHGKLSRTNYPNQETAIKERMKIGNISYPAAKALVQRGTIQTPEGWHWTYDTRLRSISSTLPYEDEIRIMLKAVEAPACLIRAQQGVPYPESLFHERAKLVKELSIHEVAGGHHVHMDAPETVAKVLQGFLG